MLWCVIKDCMRIQLSESNFDMLLLLGNADELLWDIGAAVQPASTVQPNGFGGGAGAKPKS